MPVWPYRIGAATPLILTGILPWVIGFALGNDDLAIAGAILISGAAGDIYVLWSIRDLPDEVLLQDHEEKAGCLAIWSSERGERSTERGVRGEE